MITQKELTIQELLREMRTLKRTIVCLVEKKYINLVLRHLKAISIKDVCVQSSKGGNNTMINSLIKDERLSDDINSKINSYNEYKDLATEKIREKAETATDEEMIKFYRDELHWKWNDIAKVTNYSVRHCQRKYNE